MSPLGFTPILIPVHESLLDRLQPIVEPISPFLIAGDNHIPGILAATGEVRQERWCKMAEELYDALAEADMALAILNGEPADVGIACEMAFAYALHHSGLKTIPIVAYRQDYRRAGETDNNLNGMLLPPYMRTGGVFVEEEADIVPAVARIAEELHPTTEPRAS